MRTLLLTLLFVTFSSSLALAQDPAEVPTPAERLVPWTMGVVSGVVIVAIALYLRRRSR